MRTGGNGDRNFCAQRLCGSNLRCRLVPGNCNDAGSGIVILRTERRTHKLQGLGRIDIRPCVTQQITGLCIPIRRPCRILRGRCECVDGVGGSRLCFLRFQSGLLVILLVVRCGCRRWRRRIHIVIDIGCCRDVDRWLLGRSMLRIRSKRRRRIHVVISIGCCRDIGRWFLLGISMLRLRSRRRRSRIHVVMDIRCCRTVHWLLLRRSMFSLRRWWRKCRIHVVVDSGCWWGVGHLVLLGRNMLRLWSRRRCGIHVVIDVSCCRDVGRWLLLGRSRLRLRSRRSRCRIHVVIGIGIGCWRGSHRLLLGINMLRFWSRRKRRRVHVVIDSGCSWSLSHVVLEGGMLCFRS
mmetsp:Transcript_18867/g.65805  ORF Transcript_18867/g.65805 Transcript_18867/m.65805 type:complete len:349 (-) Transcript_18867:1076-2122(-)